MSKITDVAQRALNHFGNGQQQLKALEELAECSARIAKDLIEEPLLLGASHNVKTIDEIADALIMLEQMRLLYGRQAVDQRIDFKLNRLTQRIDGDA